MMKWTVAAIGLSIGIASTSALAQGFNQNNLYIGGGIGVNSVSGWDDAVGFQVFAGYEFDVADIDPIELAVEVGYMDTGDFERGRLETSANGLWVTGVASYALNQQFSLLGRLGVDFGDDDGLMVGVGVGYAVNRQVEVRGEYVVRDEVDSLQANVVYRF